MSIMKEVTLKSPLSKSEAISRRSATRSFVAKLASLALMAVLAMTVAAGCGGKPQFCTDRDTLQTAVQDLPSAATSGGVSALEAQVKTVETDAKALSTSAKADYPTESSAIESSITQLQDSIKALPSDPSATQLAALGINAAAVVNSVKAFTDATNKDCK